MSSGISGFSMELASGALTRLQGMPFADVCRHGEAILAGDGQSLWRVGGDSDNGAPIAVRLGLPATDCGQPGPKRLRAVRLVGRLGGEVAVSAESDSGVRLEGAAGPAGESGLPGSAMAGLGRGYGRFWRIDLAAGDGAALDIGAIEAVFTVLDRRPK